MGSYIIPIIAASLLLIVIAVVVLRYALTPRITAPLCGHCRYDVTGLPTDICPECGANLNVAGILRPGSVRPMSAWMKLSLWTLSVAAIGVIATPPILRSIPPLQQVSMTATLGSPRTQLYNSVSINGQRQWRGNKDSGTSNVDITLTRLDGQLFKMQAGPERGLCWYTDAEGRTHRDSLPADDLDIAARSVLEWMTDCGLAASDQMLLPEAREIAQTIGQAGGKETTFRSGGTMMFGSLNSRMSTQMRTFSFGSSGTRSGSTRAFSMGMGPYSNTMVSFNSGQVSDPWPKRWVIGGWGVLWSMGVAALLLMALRRNSNEPAPAASHLGEGVPSAEAI